MLRVSKHWSVFLLAGCLLLAQPLMAADGIKGNLVSVDWLEKNLPFKSADEIRRMLNYLGVKPEQQIYTCCGGGIAASVPFFALKFMLGYPKVKLFVESELGWLRDDRAIR